MAIQSCIVAGGDLVGCDTLRGWAAGLYHEIGDTAQGPPRYDTGGARHGVLRDDKVRYTARGDTGPQYDWARQQHGQA